MDGGTRFRRNDEIICTEMDGSLMMMSIEEGKYFELNPVSKRIWDLFENENSFEGVITILLEEYEIAKVDCETQVAEHILDLVQKKVIFEV